MGQIFSAQRRTRRKSGGPVREFPPQPVGSSEVCNHLLRRELCQPLTTFTNHQALGRASSGRLHQKSRRRELQEIRNPEGLGSVVCLTQQPPPVPGCVTVKFHSACAPRLLRGHGRTYPHTALFSHAGSPAPPWVAGSPVAFLVATSVAASRCAAGLDFLWGAVPREGRHLGALKVVFCPQAHAGHVSEQYVGRLSHDRTTERHWQRLGSHRATVPKEVPCGSSTPAAAHATSPRAVAVRLSSVPFHREVRPGWDGGLSLGPLPSRTARRRHRRIAPTVQ